MRAYFVISFALYGILATILAVSNWTLLGWPWRLLALLFVPFAIVSFAMTAVAAGTKYRR